MSRGESYGGGQSSLGYLFGSDQSVEQPGVETPPSKIVPVPPYGIDTSTDVPHPNPNAHPPSSHPSLSPNPPSSNTNTSPRPQPQQLGNFLTDRPSTKVKSVPGGDSSLGYLFGDK